MTKTESVTQRFLGNLKRMVLQGTITEEQAQQEFSLWQESQRRNKIQELSDRVLNRRDEAISRLSNRLKAQG